MKKIFLFIVFFSLLTPENGFSQFQEKLTNTQFNKLLTVFKGRRSDFGSYYFNNFPCSQCSNGYFYIKEGNSLESSYSYKGISFKGILKSPQLNYKEKVNKLYLTSSWFNTGNTGGYKSANISFEFSFGSNDIYKPDWNTLLRFQSGNSEMVAYYTLTTKQLDDVFLISGINTLSQDIVNKIINEESTILDIKEMDSTLFFNEKKLNTGGIIYYHLVEDAEEDTDFLYLHSKNSTKVYKFFIQSDDFDISDNFFNFHISNFVYDENGKCKRIDYRVSLKLVNDNPIFNVQKISETPYCAG